MVKTAIVGGAVDNALIITNVQEHRGGAATVKIDGVAATEPAENLL